jgi:hypothetical protein
MSGGFDVASDELSDKSAEIGEVSTSIRECVAASDEMGVGGLVYGVLFDPTMLPILSEAKDSLASMIGSIADAASQISANLKKNADTYASVETFLIDHFNGLQAGGGGGGQ